MLKGAAFFLHFIKFKNRENDSLDDYHLDHIQVDRILVLRIHHNQHPHPVVDSDLHEAL